MRGQLIHACHIGGHCPMLSMCSSIYAVHPPTGLYAMPHLRLSGAGTNKSFQGTTDNKNTNDIGIQQQPICFHPCMSPPGIYRTSLGHLAQFSLLGTKGEGMVQF